MTRALNPIKSLISDRDHRIFLARRDHGKWEMAVPFNLEELKKRGAKYHTAMLRSRRMCEKTDA